MEPKPARPRTSAVMMTLSILAVCVLVPSGFISSGTFATWLRSTGIRVSPNFSGGRGIAEFTNFSVSLHGIPAGMDASLAGQALALRCFTVSKVAFRRFSGVGIAPRVNLSFQFAGRLPDPQNSPNHFSLTTIHAYINTPADPSRSARSPRAARVDFEDPGWSYEAIIDGFHDQALIYDCSGKLVARGLGLYVEQEDSRPQGANRESSGATTTVTAALPLELLGDPARGEWRYYVLAGLTDSRDESMMLHSAADGPPTVYCGAVSNPAGDSTRPRLRPLIVRN